MSATLLLTPMPPLAAAPTTANSHSLLLQRTRTAEPATRAECPLAFCPGSTALFDARLQDGEWTCITCEQHTCAGCGVVCDLASCAGAGEWRQDCLCRRNAGQARASPLWQLRLRDGQFALNKRGVLKLSCDPACRRGRCDTRGLQCAPLESTCDPWWMCPGVDPPTPDTVGVRSGELKLRLDDEGMPGEGMPSAGAASFVQLGAAVAATAKTKKPLASVAAASAAALRLAASSYNMLAGQWRCARGGLPPAVRDPETLLERPQELVIFDAATCDGGAFDSSCLCWDDVERLRSGGDFSKLVVSDLVCDGKCALGACAGLTCSVSGPPSVPSETTARAVEMEEASAVVPVNNLGTVESPA